MNALSVTEYQSNLEASAEFQPPQQALPRRERISCLKQTSVDPWIRSRTKARKSQSWTLPKACAAGLATFKASTGFTIQDSHWGCSDDLVDLVDLVARTCQDLVYWCILNTFQYIWIHLNSVYWTDAIVMPGRRSNSPCQACLWFVVRREMFWDVLRCAEYSKERTLKKKQQKGSLYWSYCNRCNRVFFCARPAICSHSNLLCLRDSISLHVNMSPGNCSLRQLRLEQCPDVTRISV